MTAQAVATPFRTTESLMTMGGIVLAGVGATVLGLVIATDTDHVSADWHFVWLVPLVSLVFLAPAAIGVFLIPNRAWTGGVLVMANAAGLLLGLVLGTRVVLPMGLLYLPAVILLWRGASRAIARRGSEEIAPGPRPYLVWAAGGLMPILAFLLLSYRLYRSCTIFSSGRVECRSESLGAEELVVGLIAVLVVALLALAGFLVAEHPRDAGLLAGRWIAALPAAAAAIGLAGLTTPLAVNGVLALALVSISVVLFFLPTATLVEGARPYEGERTVS